MLTRGLQPIACVLLLGAIPSATRTANPRGGSVSALQMIPRRFIAGTARAVGGSESVSRPTYDQRQRASNGFSQRGGLYHATSASALHPMRAWTSMTRSAFNGATPIAIANATMPSIRPTERFFDGFLLPASSAANHRITRTHRKHRMVTMRNLALQKNLLEIT